ncbi:Glucose-6-phosphate isomerase [Gemmata obscuriglobus]|uniref:glucose-6-phosphate isomerase n=1 Tax=Gemmata obscuriglobus TaxID=114 RepID=UPI00016C4DEA|nr:glucose-6-phosphate isomerase [Gemmata obscuriglobus]QEG28838.1 Glucose-6-phosphate isomerase [Gemmata obscuriglobus]VTS07247.1 glucose-6-phosphate isomerase : Glucose-6-phosphate isomerase OS=Planctomyces brasiliensis (strain ATCC 49424 / DSM 5305 / JCM 21570 / NBRC 103401 / IFAM 1448) GN=Plabr_3532 PE=3 SV=1: PGI [Gemmata obscuriglobus UQM 2246]
MPLKLPDENIEYQFSRLLATLHETWTPLAELQQQHLLPPEKVDEVKQWATSVRGQVVAERELQNPPPKMRPLQPGFIDLPQKMLDGYNRRQDLSDLGKVLRHAQRLRDTVDRVVVVGAGGSHSAPRAIFQALVHAHHNELPAKLRMGKPRIYFEGHDLDNDSLQELFELLENTCVDPELIEERWGVIVSDSGGVLETAATYRAVRGEAAKFYGPKSDALRRAIVPIASPKSRLRDLCRADGFADDDILTAPDEVNPRFGVFGPAGLLPAAVMGLDVRAMLLGAATITRRFIEEPFDRNPVLQFATVNHLMAERGKPTRVTATWSRKLEAVGWWYDALLSESLGKNSRGPTPLTVVGPRDLHTRGQQLQDGTRDKLINNLVVRQVKHPAVMVGMSDRNEDDLNQFSRKGMPDILDSAVKGAADAYHEAARPGADIILPMISEHTIGQLLQMMMLATVVEGRLAGTNPYGQPGVEAYKSHLMRHLKSTPNLPKGEVRDATKGA